MNDEKQLAIWARWLDGQELTPDEQQTLRDRVWDDDEFRRRLDCDAQVEALLQCASRTANDDDFVQSTMRRVDAQAKFVEPEAPPRVATAAVDLPPVRSRSHQVIGTRPVQRATSNRWRHRRPALIAAVITVSAAAVVMLFSVWVGSDRDHVARPDPSPQSNTDNRLADGEPGNDRRKPAQSPSTTRDDSDKLVKRQKQNTPSTIPESHFPAQPPEPRHPMVRPPAVRPPGDSVVENPTGPRPVPSVPTIDPPVFARLTGMRDAVWNDQSSPAAELTARRLVLRTGIAEVTTADGARLTLTGPIDLELTGTNQVRLHRGRLSAVVSPTAVGFEVLTPGSTIIDLGTAFTVAVDSAGATEVGVQEGVVEMKWGNESEQSIRLTEDQYKWVSADGRQDLDWQLVIDLVPNRTPSGMTLNDERFELNSALQFQKAFRRLAKDLSRLSMELRRRERLSEPSLRGLVLINGERQPFLTAAEFQPIRQNTLKTFRQLWEDTIRVQRGDSSTVTDYFDGLININGRQIRLGNFEDLLKAQEEMMQELRDRQPEPKRDGCEESNRDESEVSFPAVAPRLATDEEAAAFEALLAKRPKAKPQPRLPRPMLTELHGINWHRNWQSALTATRERPIMWFRVLGDLDGFM